MSPLSLFTLSTLDPTTWNRRDWQLALVYVCCIAVTLPLLRNAISSLTHAFSLAIEKRKIRNSLPNQSKSSVNKEEENGREKDFESEREVLRVMQQRKQESMTKRSRSKPMSTMPLPNYELQVPEQRPLLSQRQVNTSASTTSPSPSQTTVRRKTTANVPNPTHSNSLHTSSSVSISSSPSSPLPAIVPPRPSRVVDVRLEQERLLKAQQDMEYQQSILKELEIKKREEQLVAKKQAIQDKVPMEPEKSCPTVITLSFRMKSTPSATTMTSSEKVRIIKRKFDKEKHTLSNLLDFLESLELRPVMLDKDIKIECSMYSPKLKFRRTNVEGAVVPNGENDQPLSMNTLFKDAGIISDSVVWVSVIDD